MSMMTVLAAIMCSLFISIGFLMFRQIVREERENRSGCLGPLLLCFGLGTLFIVIDFISIAMLGSNASMKFQQVGVLPGAAPEERAPLRPRQHPLHARVRGEGVSWSVVPVDHRN